MKATLEKKFISGLKYMLNSSTFDSVNHQILLTKMAKLGFSKQSLELIRSYLTDRIQIVQINDSQSKEGKVAGGITQGSCLGPNLFNLYINDMRELNLSCLNYRYADDSILIWDIGNDHVMEQIENDLMIISNYYAENKLKLNLDKSKYLIIGKRNINHSIVDLLNSKQMIQVDSLKYLGVIIDPVLSFNNYSEQIRCKLSQTVGAISVLRNRLSNNLLMNFFHANFQSHMSYCAFLLLRSPAKTIEALQVLQNRCLKLIYGLPLDFDTAILFKQVAKGILPIMGLLFYSGLITVKKSLLAKDDTLVKYEELKSDRLSN